MSILVINKPTQHLHLQQQLVEHHLVGVCLKHMVMSAAELTSLRARMIDLCQPIVAPPTLLIKPLNEAGEKLLLRVTPGIGSTTEDTLARCSECFLLCEVNYKADAHFASTMYLRRWEGCLLVCGQLGLL